MSARAQAERDLRVTPVAELVAGMSRFHAAAQAAGMDSQDIGRILDAREDLPRPLLDGERAVLLAALRAIDGPGRTELLAQADKAMVSGYCGCGCATVDLVVKGKVPAAPGVRSPIDTLEVRGGDGERLGGILGFLADGYLSLLEVFSYDTPPISPFPSVDRLAPYDRPTARLLRDRQADLYPRAVARAHGALELHPAAVGLGG